MIRKLKGFMIILSRTLKTVSVSLSGCSNTSGSVQEREILWEQEPTRMHGAWKVWESSDSVFGGVV